MMKKYNKPEIVTLALEMVDVIETSGEGKAAAVIQNAEQNATIQTVSQQIEAMDTKWSW